MNPAEQARKKILAGPDTPGKRWLLACKKKKYEPNQTTIETFKKTDAGEDLHRGAEQIKNLLGRPKIEDLENDADAPDVDDLPF